METLPKPPISVTIFVGCPYGFHTYIFRSGEDGKDIFNGKIRRKSRYTGPVEGQMIPRRRVVIIDIMRQRDCYIIIKIPVPRLILIINDYVQIRIE